MRLIPPRWQPLACCLLLFPLAVQASEPASHDPLRLIPSVADLVVKVEQPKALIELFLTTIPQRELQGFKGYREFTESTGFRRFQQLLGYFEKELGRPWPELVDQLAGHGAALAVKFEKEKAAPTLVVLQGRNAELTKRFYRLALQIAEQELARQEIKLIPQYTTYKGIEVLHAGDDFHAAIIDAALLYSNKAKAIELAIDLHLDPSQKSVLGLEQIGQGKKLLPESPLAWLWVTTEEAKKDDNVKNLYSLPNVFFPFPLTAGGMLDTFRRSPFVVAGLSNDAGGLRFSVRMPAGKEGMHEAISGHVPPDGAPGLRPLLEPKGVLFTTSFYHDTFKFWEKRGMIIPADQLSGDLNLDKFDKESAKFLFGTRFSQLLGYLGTRHRFVVAKQENSGYPSKPANLQPAYALVTEMREPEKFAKAIEAPLRGAGLLASTQVQMKLVEEKHGAHKIIGYRFNEKQSKDKSGELTQILMNFSPCFVRVGDQFIFSSTLELARNLIDEIEQAKTPSETIGNQATVRAKFSWSGLSSFLYGQQAQLVTQSILADGSTPEEAQQQLALFLDLLAKLGTVEVLQEYDANQFRYDFRVKMGLAK